MGYKKFKFASALVCAAFAPQTIGFCAPGIEKSTAEKNAEKYKKYLDNSVVPIVLSKGSEKDQLDDDFESEDFDFGVQNKVRGKGLFHKISSKISSYKRRYRKLVDLVKKVAVYGTLGYSLVNFAPIIIDKIGEKPKVDSKLLTDDVSQSILKLMQNPKVEFAIIVSDTGGKELNEVTKKESVGDVVKFLTNFERMYKESGGNIDVGKFESGIIANFENDSDRERMVRYCANLRGLPADSIAKYSDLGDEKEVKKQLDLVINFELKRINKSVLESQKNEYRGFNDEKGSQDFWRDVENMWQGAKKAGLEVGGQALTALGSSLTIALPGPWKIVGIACTVLGALSNYFNNEKKMQEQKSLMQ